MSDIFTIIHNLFTSRGAAIIITSAIITICALLNKQIRASFLDVIKCSLNKYILLYLISYLLYISFFTYAFFRLKWWDINKLKDTIIWFLFSGLPIGFFVATKKLDRDFWKNIILKSLTFVEIEKFLINLFNFSFIVELILVPFIMLIELLNFYLNRKEFADKKFENLNKLVNIISNYLGLFLLSNSFFRSITEIQSIVNMNTFKSFLLPVAFIIISLPYLYILKQYSEYERQVKTRPNKSEYNRYPRAAQNPKTSAYTNDFETTLQFSDSKKEELVGYMTKLYGAKEVKINFILPSNTSSNGLIYVDYYTDTSPTRTGLNNYLANIILLSESLAEESGISNPNVSVCAMTMDGTPLGVGNYYSSAGKANIDVRACPK